MWVLPTILWVRDRRGRGDDHEATQARRHRHQYRDWHTEQHRRTTHAHIHTRTAGRCSRNRSARVITNNKQYYPIKDWGRISVGLSEHLYAPEIVSRATGGLPEGRNNRGFTSIRRWWPCTLAVKLLKNCLDLGCRGSYAYHLFLMSTMCPQLSP